MTGKDVSDVLAELAAREPLFHHTELGTSRADFESMTADDFWEVGASGSVYDREGVWATLERRYAADEPDEWEATAFDVRPLSSTVFLLTYHLRQRDRHTRRATVWEWDAGGWRVIYHQGTPISGAD